VVPHVFYGGAYPTAPLADAAAGPWTVSVTTHFRTLAGGAAVTGTLTATGSWAADATVSQQVSLPAANSSVVLSLPVPTGGVRLWWPNGYGQQPLYNVTVSFTPSAPGDVSPLTATRRIGFRTLYTVTADDSNPSNITGVNGSGDFTMRFKVNGADSACGRRAARVTPPPPLTAPRHARPPLLRVL
jgi:beta-mannosidase